VQQLHDTIDLGGVTMFRAVSSATSFSKDLYSFPARADKYGKYSF